MAESLEELFAGLEAPSDDAGDRPLYAVTPVPAHPSYFLGRDRESLACFLVAMTDRAGRVHPPIRLESLDVQFELRCYVRKEGEPEREGSFTVIRCRSADHETVRYFLAVCATIMRVIGGQPTRAEVAATVNRLAAIFQKILRPPARSVTGLFGELFILWKSGNPARALAAWRLDDKSRFDFTDGDVRLDVKATVGRTRIHTFSYDQCNPPGATIAIVASLFVEQVSAGISLGAVMKAIEDRVAGHADLVLKLHETVSATLGSSLAESLSSRFDVRLAAASLQLFHLDEVPAIRAALPSGVSDVHFKSDLSTLAPVSVQKLIDRDPVFWDLLPGAEEVDPLSHPTARRF